MSDIKENYEEICQRIASACERSGRSLDEVTLIAVSKTKPIEMIQEAIDLGMRVFGENKPQEIRDKAKIIKEDVEWHMIGKLQSNKIKYVIENCKLIHSVDSWKLAQNIEKEALKRGCDVDILLQVNISHEESKSGFDEKELLEILPSFSNLEHVHVKGLMTIPPYVENSEENRQYFRRLREIYIDIKSKNIDNVSMNELSMGMTADYEVAIEEGATFVRVGTGIFGERIYKNKEVESHG